MFVNATSQDCGNKVNNIRSKELRVILLQKQNFIQEVKELFKSIFCFQFSGFVCSTYVAEEQK